MTSESVIVLIEFIIITHCIFVCTFLFFIRKKRPLIFLVLFILVFGLSSIRPILSHLNIEGLYIRKHSIFQFKWLAIPLLYLYTQHVSILKLRLKKYLVLIPGIIEILISISILFIPSHILLVSSEIKYPLLLLQILDAACLAYNFFILYLIYLTVKTHKHKIENQYSYTVGKELIWIDILVKTAIPVITLCYIFSTLNLGLNYVVIILIFKLLMIYWITFQGLFQHYIQNLFLQTKSKDEEYVPYNKIPTNTEKAHLTIKKIDELMLKEELYLNPNLNINNISEQINEHPKFISKIINDIKGQNFNRYINSFRVDKAKELLFCKNYSNFNIEGIGKEAGFKSNSSFYRAFKKEVGYTPLIFVKKREQLSNSTTD